MTPSSSMRTPLGRVRGLGSAKAGTEHFWRQRLTALANIPLTLAAIGIAVALVGKDAADARALLSHPLAALALMLFVLSVSFHMRLGLQTVIEDYVHGPVLKVLATMGNTFFAVTVAAASLFALLKISFGA